MRGGVRSALLPHCPPKQKPRGALTQTQALAGFSESLVMNEVHAVRVAEDQTGAEGPYWLAKLSTRSYQNEEYSSTSLLATLLKLFSSLSRCAVRQTSRPHHHGLVLTTLLFNCV